MTQFTADNTYCVIDRGGYEDDIHKVRVIRETKTRLIVQAECSPFREGTFYKDGGNRFGVSGSFDFDTVLGTLEDYKEITLQKVQSARFQMKLTRVKSELDAAQKEYDKLQKQVKDAYELNDMDFNLFGVEVD